MKKQNITFIPYAGNMLAEAEIRELNYTLGNVKKLLASKNEDTLEVFFEYQADPAHKRNEVLAECEEWMNSTNCPAYLREENRLRAYHSCDNDYIDKLLSRFDALPCKLAEGDIAEVEDEWVISEALAQSMKNKYAYTLSDDEMRDFEVYTKLVALATKLREKSYYFDTRQLQPCDSDKKLAERMVAGRIATTEEMNARMRELGM